MDWTRGPTIGRGSSAAVSLATTAAGGLLAVKSTDLSSSAILQREESLLSQLCSLYVVKCFGSDITRENGKRVFNVFLEYVSGGTLSDLIKKRGGSLEERGVRFYLRQLLLGLDYLHRKGIVHCDVKGRNVLVGDDGLKIADFGCAKWFGSDASAAGISGTPAYMAPEVARGEEQGFPADVWAAGCTAIEMATGCNPWPEMKDPAAVLYRVGYSGDVPEFPRWFSEDARDLLGKCLTRDPKERWTASELLQHPFFESAEENCNEELVGEVITRRTPTTVMDRAFWNALEASESSRNPSETEFSPARRIMALIGGGVPAELSLPGWTEEADDWLTVRGNGDSTEAESVTVFSVDHDVLQTSELTEGCLNGDAGNDSVFPVMSVENNFVFTIAIINEMNSFTNINFSGTILLTFFYFLFAYSCLI